MMFLKNVLKKECFKEGIKGNLRLHEEEYNIAISKTLNSKENNSISVEITVNNKIKQFENSLHVDVNKNIYLLESRLFNKDDGNMVGTYLEVFDKHLNIVEESIDDVWSYANWEVI